MERASILEKLAGPCAQAPELPAIVRVGRGVLSRRHLSQRARAIARGFAAAGLRAGDKVLFVVRPDVESVVLMIGISEAGGVLVPLDVALGSTLFAARMELLSPQWVVVESALLFAASSQCTRRILGWCGIDLPPLAQLRNARYVRVGWQLPGARASLSSAEVETLGAQAADPKRVSVDSEEAAFIVSTAGSTGAPKAVVHSWRSMHAVFDTVAALLDARPGDVIYARELHLILPALFAGASVVVPRRSGYSPARAFRELTECRITHLFCVTSECQALLEHVRARRLKFPPTLREIWIGAAPVHAQFLRELREALSEDARVWCIYGMTEILPVARVSLEEKVHFAGEGDLVGTCVPGVHARVATNGELMLSGPNLFCRYFGQPRCVEHATGDLARLAHDRVVLLGRAKDMIIRGRFNIYPELYEVNVERIEGVLRCAMVGIYDTTLADERIVLVVEPHANADPATLETRLWRELRAGPMRIDRAALPDVIVLMPLPRTARSGKIDKQRLREMVRGTACASR